MSNDQQETKTVDGNRDIGSNSHPVTPTTVSCERRLRLNPNNEHQPDSYDDMQLEFPSLIYSCLEKHLPPNMLASNKEEKAKFMTEILLRHFPHEERAKAQMQKEYRLKIKSNYKRLNRKLHTIRQHWFVPSFLEAVKENTERSFRTILSEPIPGVFVFDMLQPSFCEMILAEIRNFEEWVDETKFKIIRPNIMNKYGVVLDDFGLDTMLAKLMKGFILPISKVFFKDVGGETLDSHHGFVVEYGKDKDVDLGLHVDDSEVTLNVCLGETFKGGELYFRGTRCEKHVNTSTKLEEVFDYHHKPGQAVLHRGHNRHGARATISGHRVNMLLWCRSSVFRELKPHQKGFSSWCGECSCEKKEKRKRSLDAMRRKYLKKPKLDETTYK